MFWEKNSFMLLMNASSISTSVSQKSSFFFQMLSMKKSLWMRSLPKSSWKMYTNLFVSEKLGAPGKGLPSPAHPDRRSQGPRTGLGLGARTQAAKAECQDTQCFCSNWQHPHISKTENFLRSRSFTRASCPWSTYTSQVSTLNTLSLQKQLATVSPGASRLLLQFTNTFTFP